MTEKYHYNAIIKVKQAGLEGQFFMADFIKAELEEAMRALNSTIGKCEKVLPKLKEGTSSHTLLVRRIKALHISVALITKELEAKT